MSTKPYFAETEKCSGASVLTVSIGRDVKFRPGAVTPACQRLSVAIDLTHLEQPELKISLVELLLYCALIG